MTVDWRVMFAKYIVRVVDHEGVDFLDSFCYGDVPGFTEEEWAAIVDLTDELFPSKGWGPMSDDDRKWVP